MTSAGPSLSPEPRDAKTSAHQGILCRIIDRAIPAMPAGRLQLTLPNGEIIERHGMLPGPDAAMTAHRWRGLRRMLLDGDHGFADGYLDGDWSTPELGQLLEFCMQNESALTDTAAVGGLGLLRNRLVHWLRHNTRRGSRRNIAAHYDLGNDFFRPWLDEGMNYSSALYVNCDTLERAQEAKLDRAAALLELNGGERVLEIGCGWGAFAERVIRHYGSSVFGITLSTEQLAYAQTRLAGEVERGRADLRFLDYRDVPGTFDRIASIEMIEAVGERYWQNYFGKLRACLAGGGVALLQAITIDERRFAAYRKCPDFIQRYIFPGGVLPTFSIIEQEAARAGLKLVHHESFGDSYVRTLREWRSRFLRAWPKIEPLGFNERFRRMWEYYLAYCEVGFRSGSIDVGFLQAVGLKLFRRAFACRFRVWIIVTRHQLVDDRGERRPIGLAVGMIADDERRAGVEFLVLLMAAGEFRADHLPGELEQLHARDRVALRRLPKRLELLGQLGVLHHRNVGRHLEHAAAAQFAQIVDEARVVLRAPIERAVHHAAVEADIAFGAARPGFEGVDLAVDHAGDHRLLGGDAAERFLDRRHLVGAGRIGDPGAQADDQAHLRPVAHVRLMIAEAMARRLDVDLARQDGVVVDEDLLPRHLDLVAQQHAVAFVVTIGQRRIELRGAVGLHRLARPQPQARRVAREWRR